MVRGKTFGLERIGLSFTDTTEDFLKEATYLEGAEYGPLRTALLEAAKELDNGFKASTLTEYMKCYRQALKAGEGLSDEVDPIDEILRRATENAAN